MKLKLQNARKDKMMKVEISEEVVCRIRAIMPGNPSDEQVLARARELLEESLSRGVAHPMTVEHADR